MFFIFVRVGILLVRRNWGGVVVIRCFLFIASYRKINYYVINMYGKFAHSCTSTLFLLRSYNAKYKEVELIQSIHLCQNLTFTLTSLKKMIGINYGNNINIDKISYLIVCRWYDRSSLEHVRQILFRVAFYEDFILFTKCLQSSTIYRVRKIVNTLCTLWPKHWKKVNTFLFTFCDSCIEYFQ